MTRYCKTFKFCATEHEATAFVATYNAGLTGYAAKHKRGTVTAWQSSDGTERAWLAWYYYKNG